MAKENEYEIVQGDGKGLNISPVEDHINEIVTKKKKVNRKNIVIPEVKEKNKSDEENTGNE